MQVMEMVKMVKMVNVKSKGTNSRTWSITLFNYAPRFLALVYSPSKMLGPPSRCLIF